RRHDVARGQAYRVFSARQRATDDVAIGNDSDRPARARIIDHGDLAAVALHHHLSYLSKRGVGSTACRVARHDLAYSHGSTPFGQDHPSSTVTSTIRASRGSPSGASAVETVRSEERRVGKECRCRVGGEE